MGEGSAVALVEMLLAEDKAEAGKFLAETLAADPLLTLWTVCAADGRDGFRPHCIEDVGQWLCECALAVLSWDVGQAATQRPPDATDQEAWARRVADAVLRADLAAQLAAEDVRGPALLLGLLGDAGDWADRLDTSAADRTQHEPTCLPAWLITPDDDSAVEAVDAADRILAGGQSPDESSGIDLPVCRRRAAEAGRAWMTPAAMSEETLPRLAAKLARLAALETRFDEVVEREKLEAMAEFAAGAGHEINNPLTVIAGRAQLFLREEQDPERRRALALMNAQAMRVYEMIADMRLFARPPQPEPERVDLAELIDQLVDDLSPQAARQEIVLQRVGPDGPVEAEVDATQLTVALRAMCQNATEAIGHEGRIEIGVRGHGRDVEIRVSDDGPGIPPEERSHLFDPYYSARQAGRGLGLGLSKCWRIVTNHGGRIEVDSQPGHGAVFAIFLPKQQACPSSPTQGG